MTREEVIKLLKIMRSTYPNTKIPDAAAMIDAWELSFGNDPANVIYKAARHHMNTCKFFPTVADIRRCINKGQLIYGDVSKVHPIAIEAPKALEIDIDVGSFCDLCGLCEIRNQEQCPVDL